MTTTYELYRRHQPLTPDDPYRDELIGVVEASSRGAARKIAVATGLTNRIDADRAEIRKIYKPDFITDFTGDQTINGQ